MGAKYDGLVERIEALEAEVAELRASTAVQLVRTVEPVKLPDPIDFVALAAGAVFDYSHYSEVDEWGFGYYL